MNGQTEGGLRKAIAESQWQRAGLAIFLRDKGSVLKCREFEDAVQSIFNACKKMVGANGGYVALLSEDGTENDILYLDPGGVPCTVDPSLSMPVRGLRSKVYSEAKSVYHNTFFNSEWERYLPDGHMEIDNVLFTPLIIEDEIIGLLGFANKEGGFNDNDSRLASAFSEFAAIALLNSKIFDSLMKSEERFSKAFNASPNPMAINSLGEGHFIEVNKSFEDVFGYKQVEVIGHTVEQLNNLVDYDDLIKMLKIISDQGALHNYETYCRTKFGDLRFGMISADVININNEDYYLWVFTDMTVHKRSEEALWQSEERFYKIFNASPSFLSIRLLKSWQFFDVNESWLHHMGYRREEVIGRTSDELNFDVNPLTGDKKRKIIEEGGIYNKEYKYRKKSGEERVGLISANIFEIAGEKYILTEIRDITELKRMENEMVRLERLNLVGEMAASIGHEIRNPMTVVRGFLQMLGEKREFLSYKGYFNIMIDELNRANSIITEYLSLARNRPVDLKTANLNTIIRAISPLVQADAMNSDMEAVLKLEEVPDLLLDEKEIRQLILNLVRNGLEAMTSGGNLTIRTFLDCEEVVLSVQDQGKGIDPSFVDKIGTPFFTTKENGTGLGLAVCYGIAVRHNAVVKVETGSGGTGFYVRFKKSQT